MARRRSQLVCQHLENISRRMLEERQDIIRDFVRGRNGVYALYRRGRLYYVGLASSLLGQLKNHLRDRHADTWDRFSVYLTIGPGFMKEIESLLIRIANPPGNRARGEFIRSENLLTRVRSVYRRQPRPRDGRKPVLADYAQRVQVLATKFKGRFLRARVRRDGRIRFGGKLYTSPSLAAAAACNRRSCDGWTFWKYERAPGDWVLLDELRK